jgi:hypothetical protein
LELVQALDQAHHPRLVQALDLLLVVLDQHQLLIQVQVQVQAQEGGLGLGLDSVLELVLD